MSVLFNQTNSTPGDSFFVLNNSNINFISSINVYNGSINVSEINLDSIRMDCAVLNSTPTLLLNGVPVAATSSFASSITTWSSYPALAPITYAVGGGTANLNNINALTSLSSATVVGGTVNANTLSTATATVSSINGAPFPSPLTAVLNVTGTPLVNGRNTTVIDFNTTGSGYYMLEVYVSGGGFDPFTCSTIIRVNGGVVTGGGFHCPSLNGNPPTFSNCVSIQDNGAGSTQITVIIYTNDPLGIGSVPQLAAYRLT
jgi:hypothetical protein